MGNSSDSGDGNGCGDRSSGGDGDGDGDGGTAARDGRDVVWNKNKIIMSMWYNSRSALICIIWYNTDRYVDNLPTYAVFVSVKALIIIFIRRKKINQLLCTFLCTN